MEMTEHEGIIQVKPSEALEIIKTCALANRPAFVSGTPGSGKTDIFRQAALGLGWDFVTSHPIMQDPTDGKGIGMAWEKNGEMVADFLPVGEMALLIKATNPTLWLIDDVSSAPMATQSSFMRPALERKCGQHIIPDCVVPMFAGNRRIDKSGVVGVHRALLYRGGCSVEMVPDGDDWCKWALANGILADIVAHKRLRPDSLFEDPAETQNGKGKRRTKGDFEKGPSPRSWHMLSDILKQNANPGIEHILCCGGVGRWAGNDYLAFRRVFMNLPNIDGVMLNPSTYEPSDDPSVNWAFCGALASRASQQSMERIVKILDRMDPEFSLYAMKDCMSKDPAIMATKAFIDWSARNSDLVVG